MAISYIGLGSNIGDKEDYIKKAIKLLGQSACIDVKKCSSFYETEPFGYKDQAWFLNAVVRIATDLTPPELFLECCKIENTLGRDRETQVHQWGPRTIDLDILFYDDIIIATDELQIPHARVHVRSCTLAPMKEIASEYVHPVINKTIAQILNDLIAPEEYYIYGTRQEQNI